MSFKEKILYMKYKDMGLGNAALFRGLINKKHKGVDVNKIYLNIVNYQVKKYGETLSVKTRIVTR